MHETILVFTYAVDSKCLYKPSLFSDKLRARVSHGELLVIFTSA